MTDTVPRLSAALSDRYRIERELGAGGMATVYLARDLKHDREVALKVLRPELGAVLGSERFLAEIRISARLDHPHILTLIDSGDSNGILWYVLPYVRGESLRDKLDRDRQLGLEEALLITKQVAGALDYAHRQGIVHRDIKPENILLQEGEAMLADFGIALAVREAGGNRLTETGLSLGTPQYMSPEQATGDRTIDARSDVYSLGAVLYEMLAGEPPVTGPNAQAMIAKLLTERPTHLRVVRETVPPAVDAAVARALAKTPADRFGGTAEFARALSVVSAEPVAARPSGKRWLIPVLAAVIGAAGFAAWRTQRGADAPFIMGRSEQLTNDPGLEIQPAISPDGRLVAYVGGSAARARIFIRPVEGGRIIPLSDDSNAFEIMPRWSPDGRTLLFLTENGAAVAPSLGGATRALVPGSATSDVTAACWSPDGRDIAFARGDSLHVTDATGSDTRLVGTADDLHSCSWSPDGSWIAVVTMNGESVRPGRSFGNLAPSGILLFPASGGAAIRVLEATAFNQSPVWAADGALLFLSNRDGPRDVYAMTLGTRGQPRGEPKRLTTGLGPISISISSSADSARMAYAVYSARANIWSVPVPSSGPVDITGATQVTTGSQVIEAMRMSPDGRWILYDSDLRGNADIWRVPLAGGQPEQLTTHAADEFAPSLSHDGRSLAYHSWRSGTRDIEVKPLDGGQVERVTDTPAQESYPVWSPDGSAIAFFNQATPRALLVVRRQAGGGWTTPDSLFTPATGADWSPDGRAIVFVDASGERAGPVSIVTLADRQVRRLFEPGPGMPNAVHAVWRPDGRTIYLKSHDERGRASLWSIGPTERRPRLLVRFEDLNRPSSRRDFATDGRRFYFTIEDRQSDVFVARLLEP